MVCDRKIDKAIGRAVAEGLGTHGTANDLPGKMEYWKDERSGVDPHNSDWTGAS